jgi:hypothetical protein
LVAQGLAERVAVMFVVKLGQDGHHQAPAAKFQAKVIEKF